MNDHILQASLDSVERMRLECGTTPIELVAERVQDARTELVEAGKAAARHGESDLHNRVTSLLREVDDFMSICTERNPR